MEFKIEEWLHALTLLNHGFGRKSHSIDTEETVVDDDGRQQHNMFNISVQSILIVSFLGDWLIVCLSSV